MGIQCATVQAGPAGPVGGHVGSKGRLDVSQGWVELQSASFLLPPSVNFVPDEPAKIDLSNAALAAIKSGRLCTGQPACADDCAKQSRRAVDDVAVDREVGPSCVAEGVEGDGGLEDNDVWRDNDMVRLSTDSSPAVAVPDGIY
jgi:hypothetical protein